MLSGYKTYIVGLLMVIAGGLFYYGYITQENLLAIEALLGGLGFGALRHGIAKK